jgi:GTP-binding protein HflX
MHVVDASSSERDLQMNAVGDTLEQIGAQDIPRLVVFNKIDLVDEGDRAILASRYPRAILVSAETGEGIDGLMDALARAVAAQEELMDVLVPYSKGSVVSLVHERCTVLAESYEENGTRLTLRAPRDLIALLGQYSVQ